MKPQTLLQGAGVAALVFFPVYANVIDGPSGLRMHSPVPLTTYILSILANLIAVTIAFALLGKWALKCSQWNWLRLLLPGLVLASVAELIYFTRHGHQSIPLWFWVLIGFIALAIALRWTWRRGENLLLQLSGATLMGFGFYCVFVVFQLLYLAAWRPLPNITQSASAPAAQSTGPSAANRPRVVWILFDEMSYNQVFDHRYPGLDLPNFDRFLEISTRFSNVLPVVNETEEAIPSILLGKEVTRVDFTYNNHLKISVGKNRFQPFDPDHTPFALARQQAMTTGIAGWYNPYCGTLAPHTNQCFWAGGMLFPAAFQGGGFWQDFLSPWNRYYHRLSHRNLNQPAMRARIRAYRELMRHAKRLLAPDGPDFVLIHLPLPHPPGFYNRVTKQLDDSTSHSYIDNLALADRTLGTFMTILQRSARWQKTSVVICSDHSWRVHMWAHHKFWTAEDEAASQGKFDPRPMLIVHVAGQTSTATVDAPFSLLGVHNVLDDLIQGKQPDFSRTHSEAGLDRGQ